MPAEVRFEPPSLFVLLTSGAATVDEVRGAVESIIADTRLKAGMSLVIDNRQGTTTRSVEEVAVITSTFARLFARGLKRVAIVADRLFQASQVFASFASTEGATVKVFREEPAARAWLSAR